MSQGSILCASFVNDPSENEKALGQAMSRKKAALFGGGTRWIYILSMARHMQRRCVSAGVAMIGEVRDKLEALSKAA